MQYIDIGIDDVELCIDEAIVTLYRELESLRVTANTRRGWKTIEMKRSDNDYVFKPMKAEFEHVRLLCGTSARNKESIITKFTELYGTVRMANVNQAIQLYVQFKAKKKIV